MVGVGHRRGRNEWALHRDIMSEIKQVRREVGARYQGRQEGQGDILVIFSTRLQHLRAPQETPPAVYPPHPSAKCKC